jgi:hypothetical protein
MLGVAHYPIFRMDLKFSAVARLPCTNIKGYSPNCGTDLNFAQTWAKPSLGLVNDRKPILIPLDLQFA